MLFPVHTVDSAPAAARRSVLATERRWGAVPDAVGRLATSPELLDGFLTMTARFEATTLVPVDREVVIMTVATRNACHICVALHTARLTELGADPQLIDGLRTGRPLEDPRAESLRRFTLAVMDTAGGVDDAELAPFLDQGFTSRQALEVVLGIGTYTLSTFANRLTRAELDPPLAEFAWTRLD